MDIDKHASQIMYGKEPGVCFFYSQSWTGNL